MGSTSESKASGTVHALYTLLSSNEGVFIGEKHDEKAAADFLITHMADLKAIGVTTLYLEQDHQRLASSVVSLDCRESYSGVTAGPIRSEIIDEALKHGIRVIGADKMLETKDVVTALIDTNGAPKALGDEFLYSPEAVEARDAYSAALISETRDGGKYVVLGGAMHSREANADPVYRSAGLDTRLGIPSIDFRPAAYAARSGLDAEIELHPMTNGTSTYLVVTGPDGRYAERNTALTDTPRLGLPAVPEEIARAMKEAGVCEAPDQGIMTRPTTDIPNLKSMIEAQYSAPGR